MDIRTILIVMVLMFTPEFRSHPTNQGRGLETHINKLRDHMRSQSNDAVLYWNLVTLEICANDYDVAIGSVPDQVGPTATSRAFAIIHGAMYDAMAAFNRRFRQVFTYSNMPNTENVQKKSATDAAIMEAAYQTLYALYAKQRSIIDAMRTEYLSQIGTNGNNGAAVNRGIAVGQLIATTILNIRQNDGYLNNLPYSYPSIPGSHQVDPTHPNQGFLGVSWGNVRPFFLTSGSQFRPRRGVGYTAAERSTYLRSNEYIRDFNEIKAYGSKTSTVRTSDQTEIGIFWAYDGAPKIGVPPRLYNQVVRVVAIQQRNKLEENAQLFALVNYAMADAGIAAWDCKYYYNFWRPIVGVRQARSPTQADPNWIPLGAPADNAGNDFTPPFPAYVSGHSTFGSAVFEILRRFYKKDNIQFQFQSDEYNGKTVDSNTRQVRPIKTRYYRSFTEAETENYLSRIYLGVHWRADQEDGKIIGRSVGEHVFKRFS